MNSKKYIQQAVVTESNEFKAISKRIKQKAVMNELVKTVDALIVANKHLDQLKKLMFYNKNNLGLDMASGEVDLKVTKRLVRLIHGVVGISTESGEMLEQLQKALRKEKVDLINIGEELGDHFWYSAIICDELGITFEELMKTNIKKLKERFKGKFTEFFANNRNLKKERVILNKIERKPVKVKAKKKAVAKK
jgi:NTP pyrophosphatase (non-canonical NTP hydrolase)